MGYKITATAPGVQTENLRNEAARRVYEELLRYKQTICGKNGCVGGAKNDGDLCTAKR